MDCACSLLMRLTFLWAPPYVSMHCQYTVSIFFFLKFFFLLFSFLHKYLPNFLSKHRLRQCSGFKDVVEENKRQTKSKWIQLFNLIWIYIFIFYFLRKTCVKPWIQMGNLSYQNLNQEKFSNFKINRLNSFEFVKPT